MTSIRQKLAELRNLAREGAPIDAAQLVALETEVAAEDKIAALRAEGEAARAAEATERERLARRAQATIDARDTLTGARERIAAANTRVAQALAELDDACTGYREAINTAASTLNTAGFPVWNRSTYAPMPVDHPDFDTEVHPIIASGNDRYHVQLDGTLHQPVDAGYVALWASRTSPGVWDGLHHWKRDKNTYPLTAPLPEIAE
ncbi:MULTISPECIES: hypothetical protein [Rhodococcus]|uniref:hypothetical protein n=1 Tax=Rhodococcus TaxID=1827 RepID=UPI00193B63B6|nr:MULTISPECIES: hypothetical protein [Rhodococcus]QRI76259.1 hypothetical protein JQ505_00040 [Rhodococcus aetherivorans]QSE59670.1 hypothetical protein JYA75_01155 [Rhodococcus sp. PSBB066]